MNLTSKGARLSEDGEAPPISGAIKSLSRHADGSRPRWYAVRTQARHEKRVRDHIDSRDLECFLPLYKTVHHWKNGCKMSVELPLFPSYLFVEIDLTERVRILEVPGVIGLVGSGSCFWPLPEGEVEALRTGLHLRNPQPHTYLAIGQKVKIKTGPLVGLTGILRRKRDELRVVLSVDTLMQCVAVEVPVGDLEIMN